MAEILLLIRVNINELDIDRVEDYYLTSRERLLKVDGSYGHSLWRRVDNRGDLMIVFEYRDMAAAEKGLEALAGIPLLAESQSAEYHPAEVIRVQVCGRHGRKISQSTKPGFLSMSVRVADPGYGGVLCEEVGRIFQELEIIPGYTGSVFGQSDNLAEEVIGVVNWKSVEAFESSLPPSHRPYEVRLYERVF